MVEVILRVFDNEADAKAMVENDPNLDYIFDGVYYLVYIDAPFKDLPAVLSKYGVERYKRREDVKRLTVGQKLNKATKNKKRKTKRKRKK